VEIPQVAEAKQATLNISHAIRQRDCK
jgi:hypothetical protein